MKLAAKGVLLMSLVATFTHAQTIQPGTFSHIIIIIQENRTPDNLFGGGGSVEHLGCGFDDPFEAGADIYNGGYVKGTQNPICNISLPMNDAPLDPGHFYKDWVADYDVNGTRQMDGFCHEYTPPTNCPSYSYVQPSDVQPYFDIATGYGFANYMFQTNEGPSFPAHQFLFTGTSAPVAPFDPNSYYLDFIADNAGFSDSGCPYGGAKSWPKWVLPNGTPEADPRSQPSECYTHDSLVTNSSGDKGVSWRYYTPTTGTIWDAPAAIPEVCYGQNKNIGGACTATEFTSHIALPNKNGYDSAPVLDDIANCNLQKISWVIPDQAWSDHPDFDGKVSPPYGPSWVGDIVDAIGNSWAQSQGGGVCDYWGNHSNDTTAIFVVWDDWGGFYDHVPPPDVYEGTATSCPPSDAPNGWGCGYVYGFRVPLLVLSQYTQAGYVSGALPSPGELPEYQHDFGSILAFTEYNFGMQPIDKPFYADYNTLDSANENIPLSDFFSLSNQRNFTTISTPYNANFFKKYYSTLQNGVLPVPTGPDGTPGEEDE